VDLPLVSIIEAPEFIQRARKIMTSDQQDELLFFLARHPESGDVIPDSGGVRKLRWGAEGRGKRGGSRVIYYFHDLSIPLVLFTVYAKNENPICPRPRDESCGRWLVASWNNLDNPREVEDEEASQVECSEGRGTGSGFPGRESQRSARDDG
jgi:hypothetical protein